VGGGSSLRDLASCGGGVGEGELVERATELGSELEHYYWQTATCI